MYLQRVDSFSHQKYFYAHKYLFFIFHTNQLRYNLTKKDLRVNNDN